jgi:subtilisin family serine protease
LGFDAVTPGTAGNDCNGHGTHVSGTVGGSAYGVAKGVALVAVRVLDCNGSGSTAGVVAGIDWVTANAIKPAVANMSLGGGADLTLDNAVANSTTAGVTYAIAAGNSNANECNYSPARVSAAITVGATDASDTRASFSNFGTCLDIFAPGANITSDWNTSNTATNTISGTSMATPHVAGAAALILAGSPLASPSTVRDAMVGKATPDKVVNPGSGSPNALLSTVSGAATPPPPQPPPGCTGANGTDVSIPDGGRVRAGNPVYSNIAINGCGHSSASASSTVEVHVVHTYRGDIRLELVAPDSSSYRLKGENRFDGTDNIDLTLTVNLSSEGSNGTWRLRIQDRYGGDIGYLDNWGLTV